MSRSATRLLLTLLVAAVVAAGGCAEDRPAAKPSNASRAPTAKRADDGIERLAVQARIPLPSDTRVGLAARGDRLWAKTKEGLLLEIDARRNELVERTEIAAVDQVRGNPQDPVAIGAGSIWTADLSTGRLYRVNPATKQVVATARVAAHDLVFAFGAVWAPVFAAQEVVRLDPRTNEVDARIPATGPTSVAAGDGSLWIVEHNAGSAVLRVDPDTAETIKSIPMPTSNAQRATFGEGALWVTTGSLNTVVRIDPRTNKVVAEILLPPGADAAMNLTSGGGYVWVASDGDLLRIDPRKNAITGRLQVRVDEKVCGEPAPSTVCLFDVAYADGSVWVTYALEKALYRVAPR